MYDLQQWANHQNKHQSATIRLFSRPPRATSTQSMQAIQTSHTCAYARRVWMYCNWCFTSLQHKLPLHACDLRLWNSSYFGALKCTRYLLEVCPASTIVCNTFMQTCHIDQTWHRTIAGASKRCFLVATGLRLAQESCHRQDCTISGQGNSASNHWATPSKALSKLQMPEWRPSNDKARTSKDWTMLRSTSLLGTDFFSEHLPCPDSVFFDTWKGGKWKVLRASAGLRGKHQRTVSCLDLGRNQTGLCCEFHKLSVKWCKVVQDLQDYHASDARV